MLIALIALGGCDFLNPKKVPITLRVILPQKSQVFNRGNHTECDWYYKVTASGRATRWPGTFLSASRFSKIASI